jgi:small subunit ribosomal protein S20
MPITKSAKKALRQSVSRNAANTARKEAYRLIVRDMKKLQTSKPKEFVALLPKLYSALDKAAKTKAISKNKASRLKSRLTRLVTKK